jgi:hypothetical protein
MGSKLPILSANNAVRLTTNGVLLLVRTGYQTPVSMDDLRNQAEALIAQQRMQSRKVLILMDDSRVTGYDPAVQPKIIRFMHEIDFDAAAIYGLSPTYRFLTNGIITADRQGTRVRTFGSERQAAEWLAHHIVESRTGSMPEHAAV